jgi:hypothetical protein
VTCQVIIKGDPIINIELLHNSHIELIKFLVNGVKLYCDTSINRLIEILLVALTRLKKHEDENMTTHSFKNDCLKYGLVDLLEYISKHYKVEKILNRVEYLKEELDYYELDLGNDLDEESMINN